MTNETIAPEYDVLSAVEVRVLLGVTLDLADDLDVECAVVVLDGLGEVRGGAADALP